MVEQPRLSAFVGRSFLTQDEPLWGEVRPLLESFGPLGFTFEDANEAQPVSVSAKVRAGIARNQLYIGILSRRDPIVPQRSGFWATLMSAVSRPEQWSPPPWVVQESGYALGLQKRVLLLIEEGVQFPVSNLDADREWIAFRRGAVLEIAPRLNQVIGHLIADTLPPAAQVSVALASPSEEPAPAEGEDSLASKEPSPSAAFDAVMGLLDKDPSDETDRAFDEHVRALADGRFKVWVPYFFLQRKAIKGHDASLEKLAATVRAEPGNEAARSNLANYYGHFGQHLEAAHILLEDLPAANSADRARLVRQATRALSLAQEYARALEILRTLLKEQGASAATFVAVADVAGKMADRDLEVSALEKALLSDPSDATVRFRLAYAYGEQENYPLALYHYKIRLTQGPDPAALNNVGVAYDALKLQGKEIESFLAAAPENDLAQGNVSYAYLDRGFFSTAEEIASAVLAKGKLEPVVRDRAAAVLQRISARRDEEKEKEEKILRDARGEAEFRALYAEAYVGDAAQPVAGQFDTPHGQLAIRQDGERITGTATRRETLPRTLLAGLLPGGATREQTRVLTLEGRVHQRAGTFTLKTEVTPDGGLSIPERSEVKGLFVIALDGRSLEVLERGKEASRNYTARLVALNLEI